MLQGFLRGWRARKAARIDSEYGHATLAERRELEDIPGHAVRGPGGLETLGPRQIDEDFDRAEGRPSEDDVPREDS